MVGHTILLPRNKQMGLLHRILWFYLIYFVIMVKNMICMGHISETNMLGLFWGLKKGPSPDAPPLLSSIWLYGNKLCGCSVQLLQVLCWALLPLVPSRSPEVSVIQQPQKSDVHLGVMRYHQKSKQLDWNTGKSVAYCKNMKHVCNGWYSSELILYESFLFLWWISMVARV